ncbi:unnamed protein product [Closterium sp. Yama58-4]|nr:unnamed protein product [Closterium sp. Yama58-4]
MAARHRYPVARHLACFASFASPTPSLAPLVVPANPAAPTADDPFPCGVDASSPVASPGSKWSLHEDVHSEDGSADVENAGSRAARGGEGARMCEEYVAACAAVMRHRHAHDHHAPSASTIPSASAVSSVSSASSAPPVSPASPAQPWIELAADTSSDVSAEICSGMSAANGRTILSRVSVAAHPGQLLALAGPSGSGKTSLLDAIGCRIDPGSLSGSILVNGRPMPPSFRKHSAYVLQVRVVCCRCVWCAADACGVLQMRVVCCRCVWCAADACGVLQMRVVCCRCVWCAADACGVLQMRVVCCRCVWCAADACGVLQMRVVCCRCVWCAAGGSGVLQVGVDDALFALLSVRETLDFAARLRLPATVTPVERERRVQQVLQQLGLTACADTPVGDELVGGASGWGEWVGGASGWVGRVGGWGEWHRGVSGGERRRTSIGVELIHNPAVLLLDEPTSGPLPSAFSALLCPPLRCCLYCVLAASTTHSATHTCSLLAPSAMCLAPKRPLTTPTAPHRASPRLTALAGLDSSSALKVVQLLHNMAVQVCPGAQVCFRCFVRCFPRCLLSRPCASRRSSLRLHRPPHTAAHHPPIPAPQTFHFSSSTPQPPYHSQGGRTVVLTIHQPSFRITALLHRMALLVSGQVAFHGATPALRCHLAALHHPVPPHVSLTAVL